MHFSNILLFIVHFLLIVPNKNPPKELYYIVGYFSLVVV